MYYLFKNQGVNLGVSVNVCFEWHRMDFPATKLVLRPTVAKANQQRTML